MPGPVQPLAALCLAALLLLLPPGTVAQLGGPFGIVQPPLTSAKCDAATQLTCGPASSHRCCPKASSKCSTFADGSPRCATCQRSCTGGPLAFDCQAGFRVSEAA